MKVAIFFLTSPSENVAQPISILFLNLVFYHTVVMELEGWKKDKLPEQKCWEAKG